MILQTIFIILFLMIAALPPLHAAEEEGMKSVAIMASEKMHGDWVHSYFNSILSNEVRMNECEAVLGEKFETSGFSVLRSPVDDSRKKDARKMMVVFGRYDDISSIPNDILARAAAIAGLKFGSVAACGVYVNEKKKKSEICAYAGCKVVDMRSKRRKLAVVKEKCLPASDQNADEVAIRDVCGEAGISLIEALGK